MCMVAQYDPKPALVRFILYKGPLLISFYRNGYTNSRFWISRKVAPINFNQITQFFFNVEITVVVLIFKTREVSRIPEPLMAMSTIFVWISGRHPWLVYSNRKVFWHFTHLNRCLPDWLNPCLNTLSCLQCRQRTLTLAIISLLNMTEKRVTTIQHFWNTTSSRVFTHWT